MTYALCGFADFGSVGIMIGGMSAMAPERRAEIWRGPRSIISGTLATLATGQSGDVDLAGDVDDWPLAPPHARERASRLPDWRPCPRMLTMPC